MHDDACRDLEHSITTSLTTAIETWRGKHVTKWNRSIARVLHNMLLKLEHEAAGEELPIDAMKELNSLEQSHLIRGAPFHMAYTDMNAILDAVQATELYKQFNDNVEFSVAVHCHSFNENIISVWVYAVSSCRK